MTERSGLAARLYAKVERQGECMIWTGAASGGYGRIQRGARQEGVVLTHVAAWELANGPKPEGMELDHVAERGCTSTLCLNVAHLELVTGRENLERAIARRGDRCMRGLHDLGPKTFGVKRQCEPCRQAQSKGDIPPIRNMKKENPDGT